MYETYKLYLSVACNNVQCRHFILAGLTGLKCRLGSYYALLLWHIVVICALTLKRFVIWYHLGMQDIYLTDKL